MTSLFVLLSACSKDSPTEGEDKPKPPEKTNDFLVDSLATIETVALFKKLKSVSQTGVLFGHQDDLAYGIGWNATPGRSDVNETCGDYPAVYGDVNSSMATDVTDVTLVLAERVDPAPEDSRYDVNGSGAVDVTDVTLVMVQRGSEAPEKPSGH